MHASYYIGLAFYCTLIGFCYNIECDTEQQELGHLPDEMTCPKLGDPFLEQIQIPWGMQQRAWKTIPSGVEVVTSNIPGAGLGVMATEFISAGTWLGEYEGLIITGDVDIDTTYTWSMTRNNTEVYDIDAGHISTSNWLRWINCARTAAEENVESCLCYGRVYYRALTDIVPGEELLVYYGDDYAEDLGINTSSFSDTNRELELISELIENGK